MGLCPNSTFPDDRDGRFAYFSLLGQYSSLKHAAAILSLISLWSFLHIEVEGWFSGLRRLLWWLPSY